MAILPVSSVGLSARRSTFTGQHKVENNEVLMIDDERPQHSSKASKLKSVPVALMIALAPMSAAGQSKALGSYQRFDYNAQRVENTTQSYNVVEPSKSEMSARRYLESFESGEIFNKYFNVPNRKNIVKLHFELVAGKPVGMFVFTRRPWDQNNTFHDIYYLPKRNGRYCVPNERFEKDGYKVDVPHVSSIKIGKDEETGNEYFVLDLTQQFRPTAEDKKHKLYVRMHETPLAPSNGETLLNMVNNVLRPAPDVELVVNEGTISGERSFDDSGIIDFSRSSVTDLDRALYGTKPHTPDFYQ